LQWQDEHFNFIYQIRDCAEIRGQGIFFDDQMPNHYRLGSETATAFDFVACRKQHSLSPKNTQPLLPIQAAQTLCHLKAPSC
jgi:hypothetical protein